MAFCAKYYAQCRYAQMNFGEMSPVTTPSKCLAFETLLFWLVAKNCACTEHLEHVRRDPKGHSRSVFGTEKVHLHIAKMRIGHATLSFTERYYLVTHTRMLNHYRN